MDITYILKYKIYVNMYLKIMCDLQSPLSSLKLSAVLGGEVSNLSETFALPPVGVRSVDHGDLVARLKVKFIGMT